MPKRELTLCDVRKLLRERVDQAGSQLAFAGGDYSLQAMVSHVLTGKRPPTAPKVLDALNLELVFRQKEKRR